MPPANVSGECVWGFIVRMYIECTFQFIEAVSTLLDHISIEISLSINGSNLAQRYISATNDAFICEILLCIFRV